VLNNQLVLDLEEVDLVDVDGVRFLNDCESTGIRYCAVRLTSGSGCCESKEDKRHTKRAMYEAKIKHR